MEKKDLLKDTIKHIDIKSYDSTQLIDAMRDMSFTSRDTARATDILMMMVGEKECTNIHCRKYQCCRMYAGLRGYGS